MKNLIRKLRVLFNTHSIDGYIIPKNDEFFSEHANKDRLKKITNFTGSAGYAIILKNKNYLFVDSRYTIQAKIESGKDFETCDYGKIFDFKKIKNLTIGLDPALFTSEQIKKIFPKKNIKIIKENLIDKIIKYKKSKINKFYPLDKQITGQSRSAKINIIIEFLKKNKLDHIFVSAPENVAWLLNIRGKDSPTSPIPKSHLLISRNRKRILIAPKEKLKILIKKKIININEILEPNEFYKINEKLSGLRILLDIKSCSLKFEELFSKKFKVFKKNDPIYYLKSIKNKVEIDNIIKAHIQDGVALTKFLFWIKKINKKKITEVDAQNKLEIFRKKNKNYMFPSFNTIAGTGPNSAIVHYRAKKNKTRIINPKDIFLCDSGGQYNYGTTDVTRTICFSKQSSRVKNIFTDVLKGHIAVATTNLNKINIGKKIDVNARKFLKSKGLDYGHGTGHGVGFFLNVHEGPQGISKYNSVKLKPGMILSNEPGYYEENKFGIRIENLVYAKKIDRNFYFENLTLAPIEKDLINFSKLTQNEKNYLFKYHIEVYAKISPYLNKQEKNWLASQI
ncbi:aminopeptidase family protein P [Candidatus Pelagibacter sp.]|nr:aminopeptidase family protein P [Candidatus Pelagibacter sp.]